MLVKELIYHWKNKHTEMLAGEHEVFPIWLASQPAEFLDLHYMLLYFKVHDLSITGFYTRICLECTSMCTSHIHYPEQPTQMKSISHNKEIIPVWEQDVLIQVFASYHIILTCVCCTWCFGCLRITWVCQASVAV